MAREIQKSRFIADVEATRGIFLISPRITPNEYWDSAAVAREELDEKINTICLIDTIMSYPGRIIFLFLFHQGQL